ncbi:hypothetical protein DFQ27_007509 [Actinomortierella ambigua]|uniref:Uncharacterized protein n=1 Tax=Actinomortierella ambigua TaxID=1343610 RepID=A0A9P6TZX3_9FUNG|nr:hypothetical protein DFQ27_007509 [Actinomortierella ambigua]
MTERARRALITSEEAVKLHIRYFLSVTKQGEWEITLLLKDLFKEYYLSSDPTMDHQIFCQWFSDVFRQYADENDGAKSLLPFLDGLLMANPVQDLFLVEATKASLRTQLLADAIEDLRSDPRSDLK